MRRSRFWVRFALLVLTGLLLAYAQVWTRLQVVAVGYALSNTRQLVHTLTGERQALAVEWSTLTAPSRLAAQATERLGLRAPRPAQVVQLP